MAVFINRQAPQSGIASLLALQGRGGDTELVHMTRPEVRRLQQSGLMSINPDTGLPEYFLGDVFDTVKSAVKNYFKPENIIPAVASIALPAIAGPAFGGTAFGQFIGPAASQALLSGTGTALGSLPFRSPSDALSAGIVSGGLQYGTGKLKEFLGGLGSPSAFEDGASVEDQRRFMAEKAREKYLQDVDARQNFIDNLSGEDFGDSIIDMPVADFDAAVESQLPVASRPIQLENQQLQQLLSKPAGSISKAELSQLGRGIQQLQTPRIEAVTGLQAMTPAETRSFIQGEIKGANQFFDPSLDQQQAMARQEAIGKIGTDGKRTGTRFTTPESFDRFATARKTFVYDDPNTYLDAAKEFGSELDFGDVGRGLASVEATSLVDAIEAQRIAQEEAAQQLISQGIPAPIARRRVAARRRVGEFGGTGAGLTAAEARRRAIEGGGFEFFGPTQFVPAAQGGLVGLAAGGSPDFEGIVGGDGHGMEDNQIMEIKGGGLLAVSPKEYVVPADVMAMIGNGNPDDGADEMDEFISKFRKEKYGRDMQPPEMDGGKALQSLMS
jgi:hypothetical protein